MSRTPRPSFSPQPGPPEPAGQERSASRQTEPIAPGEEPPPEPLLRAGDILMGKYRVESILGSGGMGVVVAATHLHLQARVALKLLRPRAHSDNFAAARLIREAQAAARIKGEHVARVMDVGLLDSGAPYIVMEYLTGRDLGAELRARGPLGVAEALEHVLQACEALAEAHVAGIVHRDLKPSNLFLTRRPDGSPLVKVLDFGIAKAVDLGEAGAAGDDGRLTAPNAILGSPNYMSPEQIRSARAVDHRTDVWSLGVILYELLAGRAPFEGSTASARLSAIAADPPLPLAASRPDVPAGLEAAIRRCLEKDVEKRTPSVAAMARELSPFSPPRGADSAARIEAMVGVPSAVPGVPGVPLAARRRRRRALGAAAAAALLGASGYAALAGRASKLDASPAASARKEARRAVAVLGFKNLSRPEFGWLSTALMEMLSAELSAGERLRVISTQNVARARMELGLLEADILASDSLERARKSLGADVVVLGSYLALGEQGAGSLRLDLRVEEGSRTLASISETGTEAELFSLVARTGARLRAALGFQALSPKEADLVRASRPANAEAARLYVDGISKLRLGDNLGARASLAAAIAADPSYPLAHAALAEAWWALGPEVDAQAEAKRAFELSAGLSREERLLVEGRYRSTMQSWGEAIDIYRGLFAFFPDSVEYGLLLAGAQSKAGRGQEALATAEALRKLPPPSGDDPRIDLAEAAAAELLSDFKREQGAAARALSKAEAAGAGHLAAQARMPLGWAAFRLGDPEGAVAQYEESRRLFAAAHDRGYVARATMNLAIVQFEKGDASAAEDLMEEALAIQRELGSRTEVGKVLLNLGNVLDDQGKATQARARFEQALSIFQEVGDLRSVGVALRDIGASLWHDGDFAGARSRFEDELRIDRKLGNDAEIASTTLEVANISIALGDLAGAKELLLEALRMCRKLEDKECTANALSSLGEVLFEQGELAGAEARFEEARAIRAKLRTPGPEALLRIWLGFAALERGDAPKAEALAREAEVALRESRLIEEGLACNLLVQALLAQGKRREAEEPAQRAASLLEGAETPEMRVPLTLAAARVRLAPRQAEAAALGLAKAEAAVAEAHKTKAGTALEARLTLGELEIAAKRSTGVKRLASVEREARKMGFARIAHRAAAARR